MEHGGARVRVRARKRSRRFARAVGGAMPDSRGAAGPGCGGMGGAASPARDRRTARHAVSGRGSRAPAMRKALVSLAMALSVASSVPGEAYAAAMTPAAPAAADAAPAQAAPANLFLVAEGGGTALWLVDADTLDAPRRFALRAPLRSVPAFTRDGRHAFVLTTDGGVGKLDLQRLELVAEMRVDPAARDLALSADGRVLAVAEAQPHTLGLFDAELRPLRTLRVTDAEGRRPSRIAALHDAASRRAFVAVLADVGELWEVSYDVGAEDIAAGKIHDFQYREGAFLPGYLNPRRTPLPAPLQALQFSADRSELLGERTGAPPDLVNLDVRKRYAALAAAEGATLRCAAQWTSPGTSMLALPNPVRGGVLLVDTRGWQLRAQVATPGPGRFAATHEALEHVWADAGDGRLLLRIDKRTLAATGDAVAAPAGGITGLEFDRDARVALAPLRGSDVLAVLDARTLAERARLTLRRPEAAYHVLRRAAERGGQCP